MTKLYILFFTLIVVLVTAEEHVKEWKKYKNGKVRVHKNFHEKPIRSLLKEEDNLVLHDDDDLIKFQKETEKKHRHSKDIPKHNNKHIPKYAREFKDKKMFDTEHLHLQDLTHEERLQNYHPNHHSQIQHRANGRNQQTDDSTNDHNHEIRKKTRKQTSGSVKSNKNKENIHLRGRSSPIKTVYNKEESLEYEDGKKRRMHVNQKAKDILEDEEFWTEAPKKKPKKSKKAFDKKKHFQKPSSKKRVKWELENN